MPELHPTKLRKLCDDSLFSFESTADVNPLTGIIGQSRAVRSLEFGLEIQDAGFNIYVAGAPGTGRLTAVNSFITEHARIKGPASDWCYVQNFQDPITPTALELPIGFGRQFRSDIKTLLEEIVSTLAKTFESEDYHKLRDEISQDLVKQRDDLLSNLHNEASQKGFSIQSTPMGLSVVPTDENRDNSDLHNETRAQLEDQLKQLVNQVRYAERIANSNAKQMDSQIILGSISPYISELKEKYSSIPNIGQYLDDVQADMASNISLFQPNKQDAQAKTPSAQESSDPFRRYDINLIVDNSGSDGAPVVLEVNPTVSNLIGVIEKESRYGSLATDFTLIRPGALHKANGGYLIIRIEELLLKPGAWETLKNCLRERMILLEESPDRMNLFATKGLTPTSIPLDVKAVLIGDVSHYQALYARDPDFLELFKVKAEFDDVMDRTAENIADFACFVSMLCSKESLQHVSRDGLQKLVEESSRIAEDQTKLSTRFAEISDLIREANYWAKKDNSSLIKADHIKRAGKEKRERSDLVKDKVLDMVSREILSIDTESNSIGQINGLAVTGLGDLRFGKPNRITTSVATGREGFIDIERESNLGGRFHTKGVMILGGYISDKLVHNFPLSMSARITFEQSYNEVDGYSASSAELYAILSRLSGMPINQGIAVTGSVNQMGEVQPIGGVNDKIEGFFLVCQNRGLTGKQGVLIPSSNVQHLMLNEDVVDAVEKGDFHIYSTETIDEGIEILTGVTAGKRLGDGSFEPGSVNYLASQTLREMSLNMRDFFASETKDTR